MANSRSKRPWLHRIFVAACILVVSVSVGVVLSRFNIAGPLIAITCSFGMIVIGYIGWRHFALSSDIRAIAAQLEFLAQPDPTLEPETQIPFMETPEGLASSALADLTSRLSILESEMSGLTEKLETLQQNNGQAAATPVQKTSPESAAPQLTRSLKKENVRKALKNGDLSLHLQPIVGLPNRQPIYFEAFMRLEDRSSGYIDDAEFRKIAESAGLISAIDVKVVFASLRMLKQFSKLKRPTGVICRLSPRTLVDPAAVEQIRAALSKAPECAELLVLQMSQREYGLLKAKQLDTFLRFTSLGVGLGLCDANDFNLNGLELSGLGFRTVKAPSSTLIYAANEGEDGAPITVGLAVQLRQHGVELIGDGVEYERDAVSLIDLSVGNAQGLLFAPPRPVKAELLTGNANDPKSASAA